MNDDGSNGSSSNSSGRSLAWGDYLEVALLCAACLLGMVGNLMVLRVVLRIRRSSRQTPVFFCGILCADLFVCATRIPTTVFLILTQPGSPPPPPSSSSPVTTRTPRPDPTLVGGATTLTSPLTSTEHKRKAEGSGGDGGGGLDTDVACEVWALSSAILLAVVWLHLLVGVQRLAIIFSFSKYRKVFTQKVTTLIVLGAWAVAVVLVYTPVRALGLSVERAARGACRADDSTAEELLAVRSVTTAVLALLPLLLTAGCYSVIMRSVWLAKEVRTEGASEYNRVIAVTFVRLLSLVVTYLPVCLLVVVEVRTGMVGGEAHHYLGHLLWMQSVASPFITLQDNDFREKIMVPNQHAPRPAANNNNNGTAGASPVPGRVLPDIGSSGGQDGEEHRARNLREMRRENRKSQLQRAISFITSADLRTIRNSSH